MATAAGSSRMQQTWLAGSMLGAVLWEAGLATQMDQHTYYIVYTNTNSVWPQHTSVTLFDLSSSHCDCPSWLEGTTEVKIAANQNIWVENSNLFFVSARSRLDWGGSTRRIKTIWNQQSSSSVPPSVILFGPQFLLARSLTLQSRFRSQYWNN